ncbi:hypothetical protein [Pseudomonas sp. 9Ag]|uniref:hypothetical protein n=1 Tax=Pseudomonas sp. 9Ag TaxID=2653167 RepID=UPI0012F389DB|nr:hypothetical protein [Pseudomonas sp. 9Ag]VXD04096.1 hypothetical protein PSEUDO9AG_90023 [Pseudomonas sp. 9Ag]
MVERNRVVEVTVHNLSKVQYRTLVGVLWLIAAGVQNNHWYELACTALFAGFSVGALIALIEAIRHD